MDSIAAGVLSFLLSMPVFGLIALFDGSGIVGWLFMCGGVSVGTMLGNFIGRLLI